MNVVKVIIFLLVFNSSGLTQTATRTNQNGELETEFYARIAKYVDAKQWEFVAANNDYDLMFFNKSRLRREGNNIVVWVKNYHFDNTNPFPQHQEINKILRENNFSYDLFQFVFDCKKEKEKITYRSFHKFNGEQIGSPMDNLDFETDVVPETTTEALFKKVCRKDEKVTNTEIINDESYEDLTVFVSTRNANLRMSPSLNAEILDIAPKYTELNVIKLEGEWFYVYSSKGRAWIHQSTVSILPPSKDELGLPPPLVINKPRTTTKQPTGDDKFKSVYTGSNAEPYITIINNTDRTINFELGGVKYSIITSKTQVINLDSGNYEYKVSAKGVSPLNGVKKFERGVSYTLTYTIVKTRY